MGIRKVAPMALLIAFGFQTSHELCTNNTAVTLTANEERRSVPTLPGSDNPSRTRYNGFGAVDPVVAVAVREEGEYIGGISTTATTP
mmetsp:Transcript_38745/g.58186  ORF Transcript_38745/g.58186 Transcript_38745/m.58186 type:complete len:87 (-) Transcript_38745:1131-1391(-)